jgi:hypothetical protein
MNKLYLYTITFVIAALMITSATCLSIPNDSKETQQEQTAQFLSITGRLANTVKRDNSASDVAPLSAGIKITGGDYNEYHPSIAVDNNGRLFAAFDVTEDGSAYYPAFAFSDDGGTTWDAASFENTEGAKKPDVDVKSSGFYATFDPPPGKSTGSVWLVDATDPNEISAVSWDWTEYYFLNFEDLHIATYTHAGPTDDGAWNWGCVAFTGYNGYETDDLVGCPFLGYMGVAQGLDLLISWFPNIEGCKHASVDIDLITNMSYAVYDQNYSGKYELFVRKDNMGQWTWEGAHPHVTNKRITGNGNVTYPDVIADSNKVLIVAQSDESGNQDIVCYYSTNGMNAIKNTIVANDTEDELYPQITWLTPEVALCTYVKGTKTYYKTTTDGGVTWGAEARVSDEQINPVENHAMAISGIDGQAYSIWQDGRGTNVDIYMDSFFQIPSPKVQIGTVTGGIGKIAVQILNTGTAEATNVDWSIIVKGGKYDGINVTTTGTISSLAAGGGSQTIQTDKFIFGLGFLTIRLTVDRTTVSKTGEILLFVVKNIT